MLESNQTIIKHKLGLLNLAEELGNVSKACKVMGLSRDTFYRYRAAVDDGGVDALFDKTRRKPNRKNRVDEAIEDAVVAYAIEQPAHGQVRVSNELRKRGTFVSPSGVRSIWLRHELHNFKLRLRAVGCRGRPADTPANDAACIRIDDEGDIDKALPCWDIRKIRDLQNVRAWCFELAVDVIERTWRRFITDRCARTFAAHQPGDGTAGDIEAFTEQLPPDLAMSIDIEVVVKTLWISGTSAASCFTRGGAVN